MSEVIIVIPGELPDLNTIIDESKKHWAEYSRIKRKYTDMVAWLAKGKGKFKKIDLEITWICKNRRKDKDNISGGGTKFILDGLVAAGVIENDGWKQIGDIYHKFKVDEDNPRIEVLIKEVF